MFYIKFSLTPTIFDDHILISLHYDVRRFVQKQHMLRIQLYGSATWFRHIRRKNHSNERLYDRMITRVHVITKRERTLAPAVAGCIPGGLDDPLVPAEVPEPDVQLVTCARRITSPFPVSFESSVNVEECLD